MYLKPELKELADNVNKTCMPTKLLAKAAKANSGCKDAYKACKGRLEDVNEVLSLCSPINSAESLTAAITSGVKNKEAGTKLQKKVATLLSARRLRRSTDASCSDFAEQVGVSYRSSLYFCICVFAPCNCVYTPKYVECGDSIRMVI